MSDTDGSAPLLELSPAAAALLEFRLSPIHGCGAFARRPIAAGERVIAYSGERISKAESRSRSRAQNPFLFCLDADWDLDGNFPDNAARFLNHSCAPNCEAQRVEDSIWIVAIQEIVAGDELTFDYGYDLDSYHLHPCRCGAERCVGFMVAAAWADAVRARAPISSFDVDGWRRRRRWGLR